MGIKKFKPTSNGRRNMTGSDFAEITKTTPEKSLLARVRQLVVTLTVISQFVTVVVDTNVNTV